MQGASKADLIEVLRLVNELNERVSCLETNSECLHRNNMRWSNLATVLAEIDKEEEKASKIWKPKE